MERTGGEETKRATKLKSLHSNCNRSPLPFLIEHMRKYHLFANSKHASFEGNRFKTATYNDDNFKVSSYDLVHLE